MFALAPHPDFPPVSVTAIDVAVVTGRLARLRYAVVGADEVVWPAPAAPVHVDGLWRTTCFELFLMFDDEEQYVEFNFSPSGAWAAYAFDGYRDAMAPFAMPAPIIERAGAVTSVTCDLPGLPHGDLRMGLSAVIEETGGTRSYWALAHAPGPPDFHNPACFIARLPAPEPI